MFQLIMVFVVALALFQYINNVATDLGFEKRFTSIDLAMITTAVYYAPGTLRHTYTPIPFPVPMEFTFENSLVDIKERGQNLHMYYWFLSDSSLDTVGADVPVERTEYHAEGQNFTERMLSFLRYARGEIKKPGLTFFKTGRQVTFDSNTTNPLQLVCPVVNTTGGSLQSDKVFLMKVLPSQSDYSNAELPTNRIVQVLSSRYRNFQMGGSGSSGSTGSGSMISAVPDDAKIVIVIGDAGEDRDPGSLVAYIPVDSNTMKHRKLACFLINDLLTPETVVYYNQIMPVYVGSVDDDSPLRVFAEKSSEGQVMVFLDISDFADEQVDVEKFSEAVYRALSRYYSQPEAPYVHGATLSFTAPPEGGYPAGGAAGAGASGVRVSGTPPDALTGSGSTAPARMFSVCSESGLSLEQGMNRLKSVAAYWAQQSLADGAVYVKGGRTARGSLQCSNNGLPNWVMQTLKRYYPSDPLPSICNPASGDSQTAECREELRRVYQEKVVDRFSGRYLCADCATYLVQMFTCALGSTHKYTTHPLTMPVIAGTRGAISGYDADGDVIFNNAVWGQDRGENCWDSVIVSQLGGTLQFGDVIQLIPNHYVLYTGGVGLDYELLEMGGFAFPSGSGITRGDYSLEINGERPSGVRTIQRAEVALRAVRKGCIIRRAANEPSRGVF
ncbi:hypothetical protein JW898_01225 [Candidatus Woesearchaeota archaeon]|nr:hypothetical protein [Candidatus Woesearchaeota archaeon]